MHLDSKNERQNNTLISIRKKILEMYLNKYFQDISDLTGNRSMSLVFQMTQATRKCIRNILC